MKKNDRAWTAGYRGAVLDAVAGGLSGDATRGAFTLNDGEWPSSERPE